MALRISRVVTPFKTPISTNRRRPAAWRAMAARSTAVVCVCGFSSPPYQSTVRTAVRRMSFMGMRFSLDLSKKFHVSLRAFGNNKKSPRHVSVCHCLLAL
jgi:hypothetical protein